MFLVNSTITWLNEKRARPGKEHTPRELYTALNEVGKNLRIMTTRDTVEAEFVSDWHDIAVGLRSSRESLEALKSINKEAYLKLNAIYQDCTNHGFNNMGQLGDFKEALTNILQLCYSSIRQTHDKIDQMTAQQEKALELAKSNHDKQMAQIESLTEANQKADDRLEALLELCEERERKEAEKADSIAAARAKRKAAKRAPRRETLSRADMVALLASCTGSSAFFRGRDRVALLILFFFGIRVGNILSISKQQLMSLYKGFPIEVSLVKDKGSAPFRLAPSKTVVAWFHSYKKDFDAVFQNTDLAPKENFYGVTRETITKRLNRYFLNYSNKVNKYLRTHSCRVTLATRVIAGPGIMAAKKLLGHRSIAATLVYDRNQMTAVEQQACYEAVAFEAPSLAKGAGRPRKNPEARSLQEVLTSPATKASPRSAPALGPKAVGKGVAPSIKGGFAGVGGNNSLEREPSLSSPLGKKSNKTLVLHAPLNPRGNFKRLAARRAPARTAASLMGTSVVKGAASSVTLKAPPVVQQPQVKKKNGVLAGKLASTSVAVSAGALAPSGTAGGGGANKKAGVNKKAGEDVRVSKGGALSGGALASSRVPSAAGVF
jgi:integrase